MIMDKVNPNLAYNYDDTAPYYKYVHNALEMDALSVTKLSFK